MAELSEKQRDSLDEDQFAFPKERKEPLNNASHVRNAIARFDPRTRMPVTWLTVQVPLSDIDSLEQGPTQFVPGSHYSGRHPPKSDAPEFEGRGPRAMLCKAGDVYLFNHQCWHRGAPNLSDRTRYLMQLQYAQRWADRRFRGAA